MARIDEVIAQLDGLDASELAKLQEAVSAKLTAEAKNVGQQVTQAVGMDAFDANPEEPLFARDESGELVPGLPGDSQSSGRKRMVNPWDTDDQTHDANGNLL